MEPLSPHIPEQTDYLPLRPETLQEIFQQMMDGSKGPIDIASDDGDADMGQAAA